MVGAGTPVPAVVNVTIEPAHIVCAVVFVVITAATFTVSVATLLLVLPQVFV